MIELIKETITIAILATIAMHLLEGLHRHTKSEFFTVKKGNVEPNQVTKR